MYNHRSISVGLAAVFSTTLAFAESTPTEVRIDASTYSNGSQNLYLCNDETGTPVLMTSCPEFEARIDDDVVHNPPHPPLRPPGTLTVINGPDGDTYVLPDVLTNSGDVTIDYSDLEGSPYADLLEDYYDTGECQSCRVQQASGPQPTDVITMPTAPIDTVGGPIPTFSLDSGPSGGGTSFGEEDRSGGGGGGGAI